MQGIQLFSLAGKTAFIAGGYGGIGEALARGMVAAGASVAIGGRDEKKAQTLAGELRAPGIEAVGIEMEANSVPSIRRAVHHAVDALGGIDVLVNCVGIQREESLLEVTEEAYDEVIRVNLKAAMFLAQEVARSQVAQERGGSHIHLLSVRAQLGLQARGYSAYCSSKGGLVMLVRQHASELAVHGIRVNGVAPTVVRTLMGAHWLADPATYEKVLARIPLRRVAEPQDVAGATLFFASEASAFVTGQIMYLDGGLTASQ
jgi:NAD(P)-dependent dehydrogenase (short-subunit alcohol dehydrogenase family)